MNTFLWGGLPYLVLGILVTGLIWRFRYDQFGWTTRSSESYERRILHIASPLFHYGILAVLAGHIIGIFIPASWTDAAGVSDKTYHLFSLIAGTAAGILAIVGIVGLVYRRRRYAPVFRATTKNDKFMYVFLVGNIALGLWAKLSHADYDYRSTIGPWARSLFVLQPDVELMTNVPTAFQIHALIGMALFAILPFTRLVHMFSAPVKYLFRPYIVYRSRDPKQLAEGRTRRGWESVEP
ncbi:respiratory nitrate reductase subunit gamma [Nonomuraea soli]|uniref:Nitrate reductase-like protein NarX n=1 Tax=Nonomuraea soli TaxID=1032476 RepID=A0A7W0CFY7_9ACTN|nr:respiratory nitrate reductase subunit gamma [Nonomuraea soli]MBA2890294.1 nitrate reductase gamma subunit [Nonomuraea soli]